VFVGAIAAVVVTITDPRVADAATVAARELSAVARPAGMRTDIVRLVAAVSTVIIAVTVPMRRDAALCRLTAKIICTSYMC